LAQTLLKTKAVPAGNIHVFLGARSKSLLLCEKDFLKLKVNLHVTTDDGSKGKKGFITGALETFLGSTAKTEGCQSRMYTCGPTPMLKAVSALAVKFKTPCEVSVEVPMACGFGACLGCAIRVRSKKAGDNEPQDHRFAIACTEGPVFQAEDLLWD
jgi:dihydroorotate dehydrogenase electron transfer subunit